MLRGIKYMTNKQRQEKLNIEKWEASKRVMEDLSGQMLWCQYCPKCEKDTFVDYINGSNNFCTAEQTEKDNLCLCAKAYNKLKKNK